MVALDPVWRGIPTIILKPNTRDVIAERIARLLVGHHYTYTEVNLETGMPWLTTTPVKRYLPESAYITTKHFRYPKDVSVSLRSLLSAEHVGVWIKDSVGKWGFVSYCAPNTPCVRFTFEENGIRVVHYSALREPLKTEVRLCQ